MKRVISYSIIVFLIIMQYSCQKDVFLYKEFSCQMTTSDVVKETVEDFKNSFSVEVPKHWNTKLYYDNLQSEIFTADTLKTLNNSYIMDLSMINATIDINNLFKEKVYTVTQSEGLQTIQDNFIKFKKNKAYYHLGKGIDNNQELHVFQCYIKLSEDFYFLAKTEIYGQENVDERLCESFEVLNSLKFIDDNDN